MNNASRRSCVTLWETPNGGVPRVIRLFYGRNASRSISVDSYCCSTQRDAHMRHNRRRSAGESRRRREKDDERMCCKTFSLLLLLWFWCELNAGVCALINNKYCTVYGLPMAVCVAWCLVPGAVDIFAREEIKRWTHSPIGNHLFCFVCLIFTYVSVQIPHTFSFYHRHLRCLPAEHASGTFVQLNRMDTLNGY